MGIGVTGNQNTIVIAAEVAESFWQQFRPQRLSREELQRSLGATWPTCWNATAF
ncbi:MAG: hypothetical protein U0401_21180 [Anaerolineae bacterium]